MSIRYLCDKPFTDFSAEDANRDGNHDAAFEVRNLDATGRNDHVCRSHLASVLIERHKAQPRSEFVVKPL